MKRWIAVLTTAAALAVGARAELRAQGVTTGGITGTVAEEATGQPLSDVQVQVVNTATGLTRGANTRGNGRYTVLGLEVGDRYTVTVRRIGYAPVARENVRVTLSQTTPVNFSLVTQAAVLSAVEVTAQTEEGLISPSRTGATTTISDSALRRLPTLNRNFTDFVTLTPQIANAGPGLSGGGSNNRFNNIQIDGATEADIFGLGSTGQPGGNASGRSISIESVKEYQVLLSPYDVRQGNFSGALINAVTKSGTNEFSGSAYFVGRNETFARDQPYITEYEQSQYGFSLGGPIVRNRAFFFINPEVQQRTEPAAGPFLGSANNRLDAATVDNFGDLLGGYGIDEIGSAGLVQRENPLLNVFARLDVNLPYNSQLVLRHNFGQAEQDEFSRDVSGSSPTFRLSNNLYRNNSEKNATVAQLRTNFNNGAFNEFIGSYTRIRDFRSTPVSGVPQVSVVVPNATLVTGQERFSQANELDQDILELTNNFTFPLGSHRITLGTQNQFFRFRNLFAQSTRGVWEFANLDSLANGRPSTYIVGVPIVVENGQVVQSGDGAVRFDAAQYAGYLQDQWQVSPTFNLTAGLRLDIPVFNDRPPFNPDTAFARAFGRSTSEIPTGNIQYSPRVGFNWDVTGDQRNQLRGGLGSFVGRPAYVWLANSFQNSGVSGVSLLTCRGAEAPTFSQETVQAPPTVCDSIPGRRRSTARAGSEINLLSDELKFPQNVRATLGYDRDLGGNFILTLEGLYTRGLNNPFYQNIALAGPIGTDRDGRVLYGDSALAPRLRLPGRSTVLDVSNQSRDYSYSFTGGLTRRFTGRFGGSVFYTVTQAMEVQGLTSSTAFSQYRFGRATAGDQSALDLTRSRWEQPHRIVAQGTYAFPTRTDVSIIYTGQSGNRFDYVVGGSAGDLNGDGFTLNDPIYVPRDAYDPTEIQFTTFGGDQRPAAQQIVEQQAALDRFINSQKCLREQRGKLMARNSCVAPWTNLFNVSVQQGLPTLRGQNFAVRLDIFNFLNLLNSDWGLQPETGQVGSVTLLNYVRKTPGTFQDGAQPIFTFSPATQRYNVDRLASNYQMQLTVRYSY